MEELCANVVEHAHVNESSSQLVLEIIVNEFSMSKDQNFFNSSLYLCIRTDMMTRIA